MKTFPTLIALMLLSGCSIFKHGQSYDDTHIRKNPTYIGVEVHESPIVLHSTVLIDPYTQEDPFFQNLKPTLTMMSDSMTRYLNSWSFTESFPNSLKKKGAPKLFAGVVGLNDGFDDVPEHWDSQNGPHPEIMRLHHPSKPWKEWVVQKLDDTQADYLMIVHIGISEYYPKQVDWKGNKAFEIGTGYVKRIQWLTALDQPVEMIQLTGMLIDREGRVVKSGMEGLLPLRTSFGISVLGFSRTTTNEDLDTLATLEREDMESHPLVWQVALHNLHARLTDQRHLLWVP